MDFSPFPPGVTAAGPVTTAISSNPSSNGWLSQLQMRDHHLHHHDERTSVTQQRGSSDPSGPVDMDVSMLAAGDDVGVPSSSSMSPPIHSHTHSHPHAHSQHQQAHHTMPLSHPHSYYTLTSFPYTAFNYGLSPYSSLSPTPGASSSGTNAQHWTVPISSYSSLNGATSSQSASSSNPTAPALNSGATGSSTSPVPQQQQSPVLSQQQQQPQQQSHSPVMLNQQQPPQHQYQTQQAQMQVMQSPHMQHSHSHSPTPTPQSSQQHQLSHVSAYLQQQQQQQQSQRQSQITIDPTLMLANYTANSYPPSAFYSYPQTLSLNPSLLHTSSSSSLASANPPFSSPSSSLSSTQQPSNQLTQVQLQQPGAFSSTTRPLSRTTLSSVLSGLLAAKALTSPNQIVRTIATMGATEVELPMRLQVLSKIRDCAGNDFYQAWAQNTEAMDIIREWLKNAVMSKTSEWEETIMPLLHVIDRLPLTVESLRSSKIGKVIVKLKEISTSSAVKDMASNLENRWRSLVNTVDKSSLENGNGAKRADGTKNAEDLKARKRKLEEAAANKVAPATKKVALSKLTAGSGATSAKPIAVKKEIGTTASTARSGSTTTSLTSSSSSSTTTTTVRDSKSDSSFFSAPKPKPKLPNFKKAPPLSAAKKDGTDPNVAQPSSVDPFKDALAAMTKARGSPTPSAAVAAANAAYAAQIQGMQGGTAGATGTSTAVENNDAMIIVTDGATAGTSLTTATGKKKKKVSFKAEKDLVQIKLIEPAVYDDDVMGANGVFHNVRDLDRDEGAAMHKHIFEEQIDWMEPLPLDLPAGFETPKGQHSQEKITQEEREKSALNALYMPSQIPDSPAEPANQIQEDEVDINVKYMLSGNEVRELTLDRGHGAPGVGLFGGIMGGNGVVDSSIMSTLSVQGLISQLAAGLSNGSTDGLGGDALSGVAALSGSDDIAIDSHGVTTAVTSASMQPKVDLKQLGLDFNLIAQLVAQHPNLSSSTSSLTSASSLSSAINNGYGYGNGASQASTASASASAGSGFIDEHAWSGGASTSSSQYGDYASLGQYDEDSVSGHRSRNWDSSDHSGWRGGRGGGASKGGRGTGRGGSGHKHTKRKLCTFFANGRCRYGDQCDFLHELP